MDSHANHSHHHGKHDHSDHHRMMIEDFKRRFWVSLVLSAPVLAISPMIQSFLGYEWNFGYNSMVLFAISSIIFFYGGMPFIKGLFSELKQGLPGMMTLIAVAISVAYFYSVAVAFGLEGKMFFWELATLIDIMLIGHWVEMRSILGASKSLELLVKMLPSHAHLVENDEVRDISLEELKVGDVILIKPGEKIPSDGTIVDGTSFLNESMLTGESKPAEKSINDKVIGGSINGNASLKVSISHTGQDSYLNKVITLVRDAQKSKSKTQRLADKAAKWLTYVALSVGVITLITWLALGYEFVYALERMVTVMVISCPHALGLAIPLVVAISTAISASNGLLIRNRTAFENSRKISTIVFDKTGTLTMGEFAVTRLETLTGKYSKNEVLEFAQALEQNSEHPIATGIIAKAKELELNTSVVAESFQAITGKGVKAVIDTKQVMLVSPGYLKENSIKIPQSVDSDAAETIVFLLIDNELVGFVALSDAIRQESYDAIRLFKQQGIKVMMATGDNKTVAKVVSDKLGLDGYFAEVLPHEKVEIVKDLQGKGEFVAMTGDGVNDAPALAQADVGIAVGSGTDIAAETADIILVKSNPKDILKLILFGKATYKKMTQNLIWATAYNAFAIPLAAGVLFTYGFVLSPAVGAVFMSLSTIVVAINAQMLKK